MQFNVIPRTVTILWLDTIKPRDVEVLSITQRASVMLFPAFSLIISPIYFQTVIVSFLN